MNIVRLSFSAVFYVVIVFALPEIARHLSSAGAAILYVSGIIVLNFLYVNAALSLKNLC